MSTSLSRLSGALARGCAWMGVALCLSLPLASQAQRAQLQEGSKTLFQRVLTLPEATLRAAPGNDQRAVGTALPAFSIFYVYGEKTVGDETWIQVGTKPEGGATGWLPRTRVEDWKSMLVMQYAPTGQRERVLFFQQEPALADLVQQRERAPKVRRLLDGVAGGNPDRALLAAAEPDVAVDAGSRPYLMPILDAALDESFHDGTYTTLVQVGGLNLTTTTAGQSADALPGTGDHQQQADLQDFRIGIVFVIDTTTSMGPYIDRTYETIEGIYREFEQRGALDRVTFGLVGYRDFVGHNPAIEYVTHVYQPLDVEAPPDLVLRNLKRVKPATVSTDGWNEDAFAGLNVAIQDLDWEPFDARLIVLVTDAGTRASNDPRAQLPNFGAANVTEAADRKRITILPVHLRTPEAARLNNLDVAEQMYRAIGRTGDSNTQKYFGIDAGSVETFSRELSGFASELRTLAEQVGQNQVAARPPLEAPAAGEPPPRLGNLLVNEVFRAQLEYIGQRAGVDAPGFYRAWAADRDLMKPDFDAFTVSVFLNRTQLSGLAQSLQNIVNRAKAADLDPGGFFDMLQSLSATMAADPNQRAAGRFDNLADSGLLPDYLQALPYHSKVLMVNRDLWLDWGMTGQQEFIIELEDKIAIYRAIDQDARNWVDLGANTPGLEVYPIPLAYLP